MGRTRFLAIGIDAAEPTLLRDLIERNELPHLASLLREGAWGLTESPAGIGSGAVWPTFSTGEEPAGHGIYSAWEWDPRAMRVAPVSIQHLEPFWRKAARAGHSVGVIDVPFTPAGVADSSAEILEWGTHDWVNRKTTVEPQSLWRLVRSFGHHPFAAPPLDAWATIRNDADLTRVAEQCMRGARQRGALAARLMSTVEPELLLVVFSEVHRGSHVLWHTLAGQTSADGDSAPTNGATMGPLIDIYREVDAQIGHLQAVAGPEADVLVFSLHGMKSTKGVPTALDPLLTALGLAKVRDPESASTADRTRETIAALRRAAPAPLRALYHRLLPASTTGRLAGPPDPMPPYDWRGTVAFALPTDQHGWVRLNVAGRESEGILQPEAYEKRCQDIERTMLALRSVDDGPIFSGALRTSVDGKIPGKLPDLILHWDDAAIVYPLCVRQPAICAPLRGADLTGQHAPDGFFIFRGHDAVGELLGDKTKASALHSVILQGLQRSMAS